MDLTQRTKLVVEKMYPPDQQEEVVQLLTIDCGTNVANSPELLERVHLAVLKLSQGYLDELPLWIIHAQTDWRDTLMVAGYGQVDEHHAWAESYLASDTHWSQPNPRNHPMEAIVNSENWAKCPHCGWRFAVANLDSWTGERHRRCGQRLQLKHSSGTRHRE